jgi:hypothetical protein
VPTILADSGLSNSSSIMQTVFVGVTNVVFTILAVLCWIGSDAAGCY